ncbi:MAG: hypothetical protein EA425_14690 [Puniceicoccaceae bacterium]|nr:MAG: hypothetical protein EA425_14690 [Puniceicoccaceae bacterium]
MKKTKSSLRLEPHWHPNFRNAAALPDLKLVRTHFFVNLISGIVALVVLLTVGYREYYAFNLRASAADLTQQQQNYAAQNRAALELQASLTKEESKVNELADFANQSLPGSGFLIMLSETLPVGCRINNLTHQSHEVTLQGVYTGNADEATEGVSAYLDVLRGHPEVTSRFNNVSLTSLVRDPRGQGLAFSITLTRPQETRTNANDRRRR